MLWFIHVFEATILSLMGGSSWLLSEQFLGFAHHCCNSQWHSSGFHWPSHSPVCPTHRPCLPAPFLVMALLKQLARTRAPCWFLLRKQFFFSLCRRGVISSGMASDPSEITRFDFLVVGGGSGGLAGARRAAELGAATAVIESHKLGGTCVSKNNNKKNQSDMPPCCCHFAVTSSACTHTRTLTHTDTLVTRFTAKPPDSFFVCVWQTLWVWGTKQPMRL